MGFFGLTDEKVKKKKDPYSVPKSMLHELQCDICPLKAEWENLNHPQMAATGSDNPLIYVIGKGPEKADDERGYQFVSASGHILRDAIPKKWIQDIRWNNVVQCRLPFDRTIHRQRQPSSVESECCRPRIEVDIEQTKPRAIFGFGLTPLQWALGTSKGGIRAWAGRKAPIKVGNHTCWFFPLPHPEEIIHEKDERNRDDLRFLFELHLHRALDQIETLPDPIVYAEDYARENVEIATGTVRDVKRVLDFIESMYREKYVGFDYETNGLRPYAEGAKLLSVALSGKDKTMAITLRHPESEWHPSSLREIEQALITFLKTAPCKKVVHELAFELEWSIYFYGRDVARGGSWGCSVSQAYILEGPTGANSLDALCIKYFGLHLKDMSGLDRKTLEFAPLKEVLTYNGLDAKFHRAVYLKQAVALKDNGLMSVYNHHMRRIPTMVLTQIKGVPVDQNEVKAFKTKFETQKKDIETKIASMDDVKEFYKHTGKPFRPSANDDVMNFLKIAGHHLDSVDENELNKINHPLAPLILDYRGMAKLISTYVDPLTIGSKILYPDGCLHPIISTTKVVTWRTSSSDPNEQNFPKNENKEVRNQVRKDGHKIVSFDFAGIQARNIAMESKDKTLIKVYWEDYDIHTDWMYRILDIVPSWVPGGKKALKSDKDVHAKYRHKAKNGLVFPSFFGAQPKKVSTELGISINDAFKVHDAFWRMFGGIKEWQESLEDDYKELGYITGLSGFRRYAPVAKTERINTPIQSDESIIVCDAMARLSELEDDAFQPIFEIHDDLSFIWETNKVEEYTETVVREMTRITFDWINTPLVIERSIGDAWGSMEKAGEYSSRDIWDHKQ